MLDDKLDELPEPILHQMIWLLLRRVHPGASDAQILAILDPEWSCYSAALNAKTHPEYATAKQNPFGRPGRFRYAYKQGGFPVKRRGREIVAKWEDVLEYIRNGCLPPKMVAAYEARMQARSGLYH